MCWKASGWPRGFCQFLATYGFNFHDGEGRRDQTRQWVSNIPLWETDFTGQDLGEGTKLKIKTEIPPCQRREHRNFHCPHLGLEERERARDYHLTLRVTESWFWHMFTGTRHTVCMVGGKKSNWEYILKKPQLGNIPRWLRRANANHPRGHNFSGSRKIPTETLPRNIIPKENNNHEVCGETRYYNCENIEITNSIFSPANPYDTAIIRSGWLFFLSSSQLYL